MSKYCYFDECGDCLYREHNDDLVGCLSNRLSLAWYKLLKETPIINRFVVDSKYCNWYQKEE